MIPARVHPIDDEAAACTVDRSCADSGCGCSTPSPTSNSDIDTEAPSLRRGLKAGLFALASAAACFAAPLAVTGFAALSGALAGAWWLAAGGVVAAIVWVVRARRPRQDSQLLTAGPDTMTA